MVARARIISCPSWQIAVSIVVFGMAVVLATAQNRPAPRWEVFAGYSFFYPGTDIHGQLPGGLLPVSSRLESNPKGAGASLTYNFNRWFGLSLDTSIDWGSGETGIQQRINDTAFSNLSLGPKFTLRKGRLAPFLEILGGDHRLMPDAFHDIDRLGLMVRGGLDIDIFRHIALRPIRADYVTSGYRYGPSATTASSNLQAIRLQAGLVFLWGSKSFIFSPTTSCTVEPKSFFPGDLATASAAGVNFNPHRTVAYRWSGSGARAGETGASTKLESERLAPGVYEVTATLNDGNPGNVATCSARFTVEQPHPPVISCAAEPSTLHLGETSTITSNATSPDGRSLAYSYAASEGNISGVASTAVFNTAGELPGQISVTCTVGDDRTPPLAASAITTLTVLPDPAPPDVSVIEPRLALHSIYFATARPTRQDPDAGLLASQENTLTALVNDFLTYLQSKPEARLTLEGHADPRGSVEYNQALSERRVDRVKRFLVSGGIPADRIHTTAFGQQRNLTPDQVKDAVEQNPELTREDRKRALHNLRTILLASNRRVDVTLTGAGQAPRQSLRNYPFNAADAMALLNETRTKKALPATRQGARKNVHP